MDVLTLSGLQYHARHGYYEEERTEGNDFEVDLIFRAELQTAAQSDDLSETIDYQRAEQIVHKIMEGPSIQLLETLANRIGQTLFDEFSQARQLEVRIRKLNPPLQTPTKYSQITSTWSRS